MKTTVFVILCFLLNTALLNAQSDYSLPAKQSKFVETVESYYSQYESAPNELKKSSLRKDRAKKLKSLISNRKVSNWIGILQSMGTNSDGDAHITLIIPNSNILIKTWNNSFSDFEDNTLIENGSSIYNQISELSEGDAVVFSGTFVNDSDSGGLDYFKEGSFTEYGSMTEPEYLFRFSIVKKY